MGSASSLTQSSSCSSGDTDDLEVEVDTYAGALIPVYPATKDLPSWTIANAIAQTLRMLDPVSLTLCRSSCAPATSC